MENENNKIFEVGKWVEKHLAAPLNIKEEKLGAYLQDAVPKVTVYMEEKAGDFDEGNFVALKSEILEMHDGIL